MTDPSITAMCRLAQACADAGMTAEQMLAMLREDLSVVNLICLIERDEPPPVFVPNPTHWIV
jgi:hypothetical protein